MKNIFAKNNLLNVTALIVCALFALPASAGLQLAHDNDRHDRRDRNDRELPDLLPGHGRINFSFQLKLGAGLHSRNEEFALNDDELANIRGLRIVPVGTRNEVTLIGEMPRECSKFIEIEAVRSNGDESRAGFRVLDRTGHGRECLERNRNKRDIEFVSIEELARKDHAHFQAVFQLTEREMLDHRFAMHVRGRDNRCEWSDVGAVRLADRRHERDYDRYDLDRRDRLTDRDLHDRLTDRDLRDRDLRDDRYADRDSHSRRLLRDRDSEDLRDARRDRLDRLRDLEDDRDSLSDHNRHRRTRRYLDDEDCYDRDSRDDRDLYADDDYYDDDDYRDRDDRLDRSSHSRRHHRLLERRRCDELDEGVIVIRQAPASNCSQCHLANRPQLVMPQNRVVGNIWNPGLQQGMIRQPMLQQPIYRQPILPPRPIAIQRPPLPRMPQYLPRPMPPQQYLPPRPMYPTSGCSTGTCGINQIPQMRPPMMLPQRPPMNMPTCQACSQGLANGGMQYGPNWRNQLPNILRPPQNFPGA